MALAVGGPKADEGYRPYSGHYRLRLWSTDARARVPLGPNAQALAVPEALCDWRLSLAS